MGNGVDGKVLVGRVLVGRVLASKVMVGEVLVEFCTSANSYKKKG